MKQVLIDALNIWCEPYRTKTGRKLALQLAQDAAIILGFLLFATLLFIATLN